MNINHVLQSPVPLRRSIFLWPFLTVESFDFKNQKDGSTAAGGLWSSKHSSSRAQELQDQSHSAVLSVLNDLQEAINDTFVGDIFKKGDSLYPYAEGLDHYKSTELAISDE